LGLGVAVLLLVGVRAGFPAQPAITPLQRRQIEALDTAVNRAGRLFQEKKYREAGNVLRDNLPKFEELAASTDKDVLAELVKVQKRLAKAHALLELEGIVLPPLRRLPAEAERIEVKTPTGKETVSFANDVAPVLDEHCAPCHGRERRCGAQLNLATFAGLWRGGDSGPPIQPGKSKESLLIRKLKGSADGETMPLQQPPLAESSIAKLQTWIDEGAAFDGGDPDQELSQFAELRKVQKQSHHELRNDRLQRAHKNWGVGTGGGSPRQAETRNFLLLGTGLGDALQKQGDTAEWLTAKVGDVFNAPSVQPLVKGCVTLYCFADHAEYADFIQKLEHRKVSDRSVGSWRYTVLDASAALVLPAEDEYSAAALLAQHIASVYVASLGKVPGWFAEGAGRVAAARLKPDDPRVADWDQQLPGVLAKLKRPDDFITGRLPDEPAAVASYGFVKFLMKDTKSFLNLLDAVRQGKDFSAAFSTNYRGSLLQVAKDWVNNAGK
jgi:hypothetical protein